MNILSTPVKTYKQTSTATTYRACGVGNVFKEIDVNYYLAVSSLIQSFAKYAAN